MEKIEIRVRLFATLRENRGKEIYFSVENDITPREIIGQLEIAESDVAILLINGRDGEMDSHLKDQDVVSIFPPVGGG